MFKLYYPKDPINDKRLGVVVRYKDVHLSATWDEESENLQAVINSFPAMLRLAGEERKIQEEISGMSAEIDKLLDDTE